MIAGRAIEILLVEDNPGDARLAVEALRDGRVHNRLSCVSDGVEALAHLRREGSHTGAARPDLIRHRKLDPSRSQSNTEQLYLLRSKCRSE